MYRTVVSAVFLVCVFGVTAGGSTDAVDLLDKYRETQDRLRSVIIKCESSSQISAWDVPENYKETESSETAFDGSRIRVRFYKYLTGEPDYYNYLSMLWDANSFTNYSSVPNSVGHVWMENENPWKDRDYPTLSRDNYLWGFLARDGKRVDEVLREVETMSVRPEQEDVGGSPCWVIEARPPAGRYILWIDPHHGYNIAQAEVRRSEGDLYAGRPLPKGHNLSFSLRNVRFERVDGIWLPMEADVEIDKTWGKSFFDKAKYQIKRTDVILNPDHDALSSFALDDIRDGANVRLSDVPEIEYTWQKGELIARIKEDIIAAIDEVTDRFRTEGQEFDSGANEPTTATAQEEEAGEEVTSEESAPAGGGQLCRSWKHIFGKAEEKEKAGGVSVLPVVIPVGVLVPVVGGIAWVILRRRKKVSDEIR